MVSFFLSLFQEEEDIVFCLGFHHLGFVIGRESLSLSPSSATPHHHATTSRQKKKKKKKKKTFDDCSKHHFSSALSPPPGEEEEEEEEEEDFCRDIKEDAPVVFYVRRDERMLLLPDESVFGNKRVASRRRRTIHRDDDNDARDEFFFGVNRRCGSLGNVVGGEIRGGGEESVGKYATTRGSQRLGKKSKRRGGRTGERTSRDYVRRVVRGREDGVVVTFADAQREETNRAFRLRFRDDENIRVRFSRG